MPVRSSKQRTEVGREIRCNAAKVKFSTAKEPAKLQAELGELAEEWQNGGVSAAEAGRMLGISRHTFTRRAVKWAKSAEAETDTLKETDYASNLDQAG